MSFPRKLKQRLVELFHTQIPNSRATVFVRDQNVVFILVIYTNIYKTHNKHHLRVGVGRGVGDGVVGTKS